MLLFRIESAFDDYGYLIFAETKERAEEMADEEFVKKLNEKMKEVVTPMTKSQQEYYQEHRRECQELVKDREKRKSHLHLSCLGETNKEGIVEKYHCGD